VEVAMENSANLSQFIGNLIEVLTQFQTMIGQKKEAELTSFLENISAFRRILTK
jgi:prephenate dehydrogenase